MNDNNQLIIIAEQSGLEKSKTDILLAKFGSYFQEARKIADNSKSITVTDENDIENMALAKQKRLELKRIRVEAEKTRKTLKEQSLREGRAIDGIANVIKALIVPVEEHLKTQEEFAERLQAEKDSRKESERHAKLSKYVDDADAFKLHPNDLSDDAFEILLKGQRLAWEAQKQAEEQAEKERIEREKKEKTYQDRKIILSSLSDFVDIEQLTIDTTQTEYESMITQGKQAKASYEEKQEQIRKENEKLQKEKAKAEEAKREAEEAKRRAEEALKKQKEEQERKEREAKELEEKKLLEEKQEAERLKRLEEEKQRKALLAPDKEKLLKFVQDIHGVTLPHLKSHEAGEIMDTANTYIAKAIDIINEGVKKL